LNSVGVSPNKKLLLEQIASGAQVIIRVSGEPLVTLP
jgi:hypothetical protein